jgi:hypothetical protein
MRVDLNSEKLSAPRENKVISKKEKDERELNDLLK